MENQKKGFTPTLENGIMQRVFSKLFERIKLLFQGRHSEPNSRLHKNSMPFFSTGFTLLEMIVSLGIFAVAALLSTSSLLSLTDAQKKAFSLQSTFDNIRFALETMARDARTGDVFYCGASFDDLPAVPTPKDCASGGPSLTYKNVAGNIIAYRILNGKIEKFVDGVSASYMTSGDTTIDTLTFYVLGAATGDNLQSRITIIIKGTAGSGRSASKFNLQTTISQRKIGT